MRSSLVWIIVMCFCFFPSTGRGCDTDLIALLAGEEPNDVFSQSINVLAGQARVFGTGLSDAKREKRGPQSLMKTWITFDNRFSQTPPAWARDDREWTAKFKQLADEIGAIDREYRAGSLTNAHIRTLAFTRKLIRLFERMPKTPDKAALVACTSAFQTLSEAVRSGDVKTFETGLKDLASGTAVYRTSLASPPSAEAVDFLDRIDRMNQEYAATPGSMTRTLTLMVAVAEDSFTKMNAGNRTREKDR